MSTSQPVFPLSLYDAILTHWIGNLTHWNVAVAKLKRGFFKYLPKISNTNLLVFAIVTFSASQMNPFWVILTRSKNS